MRLFVRNGKGERERYTVLPKASLEMLRKYYKIYKPRHSEGYIFLNEDGKNSKKKFFILIKVMSRKFRGKFLYYLKQEKLEFYGKNEYLKIAENFDELMGKMYTKEWITYCKPPFEKASRVIKYLGRYTHRVTISNNRILKEEKGKITFKYRDRKDNNKEKEMTLEVEEFIRRFLLHILPPGFMKIRHYGLLISGQN